MTGIAVAVTSIPVISKILHDLGILHTRFACLILGVAVFEDVRLWVVVAIATAPAQSGRLPQKQILLHRPATLLFFGLGLSAFPNLLRSGHFAFAEMHGFCQFTRVLPLT